MAIIEALKLTKYYGKNRGVVGLDFAVEKGEVFGYLGPNGAGKTTTIRLLLDLIRPTSGHALVFGLDSHRQAVAVHRRLGDLPGELALYGDLTGEQTLKYLASLRSPSDWGYVQGLARQLDCDLSRPVKALSHGNKQKLGLIQAFMHRPELLVLDEPTTGLDPLIQREFYGLIDEARAAGQTVFLSSHILPEVERICDRAAIIREGKLVAVEQVAALKAKAVRHLEITFSGPPPLAAFAGLPGVRDVTVEGDRLRCTVVGPLDAVVKAAGQFTVVDLISHEPSLEDVFLAYYGRNAGGH